MDRPFAVRALLVFVAVFGVGYVLTLPPFGWGDEVPHYLRALRVSRGAFLHELDAERRGGQIPLAVRGLILKAALGSVIWKRCELDPRHLVALFRERVRDEETVFMPEFGAPYSPVASAHTGAAIAISRAVSPRPAVWFYAARLTNLAVWTALCSLALSIAPVLHASLLALMIGPMALFLAATLSVDALLDALAFVWAAYVLRLALASERTPSRVTWAVTLTVVGVMSLVKLVYAPLALLLLAVPARGRTPWRPWIVLCAAAIGVSLLCVALWLWMVSMPTSRIVFNPPKGTVYDPSRLFLHPFRSLFAIPDTARMELTTWLHNLAWPQRTECLEGHRFATPLFWGAVVVCLLLDAEGFRPPPAQRLVGLAVFLSVFCTTILLALATWTPLVESRAIGVNARYFLPALPALALAVLPPALGLTLPVRRGLAALVLVALAASVSLVQIAFLVQYDWRAVLR